MMMSRYDQDQPQPQRNRERERLGTRVEDARNAYAGEYRRDVYGSPYDVGNYASHYDQGNYAAGGQRLGFTPEEQTAREKGHGGKGPRGYQRSDKRILEDVNDRLYLDPYLDASDIEVLVDNRDVTLTGTVHDRMSKRRAEDIADSIPGVKNVENRIRVTETRTVGPVRSNTREELM